MLEDIRILGPFLGLWIVLFSIPLFLFTPDRPSQNLTVKESVRGGTASLVKSLRSLPRTPNILWFLIARMVFVDGLNTVFAMAGIYLTAVFLFEQADVIIFFILLNIAAGLGSFGLSWIDDVFGAKLSILISLCVLIVTGFLLTQVTNTQIVWMLAALLSVFIGPLQSSSRTLMGRLAPEGQQGQMFGLYALSGKATAFLGPLIYGSVLAFSESHRLAMMTVISFLVVGLILMIKVREPT